MSRAEAEARAAQRHFEAMIRKQQKEELVLSVKREVESQEDERMRRTIAPDPNAAAIASDRLYQQAIERQAKLELKALERHHERVETELEGATFVPQITTKASKMRTDGRPVEMRIQDWYEAKQTKLSDAAAASAGRDLAGSKQTAERSSRAGRAMRDPAYQGGKMKTVEDIS